jgi:hypothetical protein
MGSPVTLVNVPLAGVPKMGVTSVGEVAKTADPVPVSSVKAPRSWAEVNEPSEVALPTEVTAPVKLVITVDATFTKSVPFQAQSAFSFKAIVTPVVGPAPRNTML